MNAQPLVALLNTARPQISRFLVSTLDMFIKSDACKTAAGLDLDADHVLTAELQSFHSSILVTHTWRCRVAWGVVDKGRIHDIDVIFRTGASNVDPARYLLGFCRVAAHPQALVKYVSGFE